MGTKISSDLQRLAGDISAACAAIYRHCHPFYSAALSHQAVRALQFASEPGATIQTISSQLGCATNTGSEIVRRLAEKGFVKKLRQLDDERVVHVQTTSDGEKILVEQTGLDIQKLSARLENLREDERDKILTGLALLLSCVRGEG
jgi:DNA-binding MarR family transcriptional regulator